MTVKWRRILVQLAALAMIGGCASHHDIEPAHTLPDLSGLAWLEGDDFLGVHDAKRNKEKQDWPRVSLVTLPKSELVGTTWRTFDVAFPGREGTSSDLESAARVPGTNTLLLAESGQEGDDDRRIFVASYVDGRLAIESAVHWPREIHNVEAIDVARVDGRLYFLYAERANSKPSTELWWAPMSLDPLTFGAFQRVTYSGVDPVGPGARPIVALATSSDGSIYSVSALDPGDDDGPFRSVVWRIGRIEPTEDAARVVLADAERIATLDGLKVESITLREIDGMELFIGTDDEHFGGIIRPLP